MGSGHILAYAFDVLMQIYESYGYNQRDAAKSIVENNLYGLDIDNRAYQLAYFAVMMKARQYNRRILNGEASCHVYAIQESNGINRAHLEYLGFGLSDIEKNSALAQMHYLLDKMYDAKEYGSIINLEQLDWDNLYRFIESVNFNGQMTLNTIGLYETQFQLRQLVRVVEVMEQKYDVVVTNPPYMGNMPVKMTEYVVKNYEISKYDLYSVFMEKCIDMSKANGYISMITQHTWMFISSFEKFRKHILSNEIIHILHLGTKAFDAIDGEVVQTAAYVFAKRHTPNYILKAKRLVEFDSAQAKKEHFFEESNDYITKDERFFKLPGTSIAYWLGNNYFSAFDKAQNIDHYVFRKAGVVTGDDSYFIRLWYEVNFKDISLSGRSVDDYAKFHIMQKGGSHRRYFGNYSYVVRLRDLWNPQKTNKSVRRGDKDFYFKKAIGWSQVGNNQKSFRVINNSVCGTATPTIYLKDGELYYYILAFLNTKIAFEYLGAYNPTINLLTTDICGLPLIIDGNVLDKVNEYTKKAIAICEDDWNSFETSWEFIRHPFLLINDENNLLSNIFLKWDEFTNKRFETLKSIQEALNSIFLAIYNLSDELISNVDEKDIEASCNKANLAHDVRSFISYAVGCMFGRYSLDMDGLVYAGGDWDDSKYISFIPDKDNIIPITDEEYFEDDIVGLFCAFLKRSFGEETLEENLDFIAKALENKGNSSRKVIRNYFLKDFFKDHCSFYSATGSGKRPIFWLFDSGRADGFKALIYMHRYHEDTIGNLRIDYLHRMQRVYENEISRMQETIENSGNAREVAAATKRKEKLIKQLKESKEYDEKIAHLALARIHIDLDDGVKVNYDKVQTGTDGKKLEVLAKI